MTSHSINEVLKAGTPVYTHEGRMRHVATVLRPIRDYDRDTASYYEVTRHDESYGVISADFIEKRYEGQDATKFWAKTA